MGPALPAVVWDTPADPAAVRSAFLIEAAQTLTSAACPQIDPKRPISWIIQIALSIKSMHLRAREEKAVGKDEQSFIVAFQANSVQIKQSVPGNGLAPEPVS